MTITKSCIYAGNRSYSCDDRLSVAPAPLAINLTMFVLQLLVYCVMPYRAAGLPMTMGLLIIIVCTALGVRKNGKVDLRQPWALISIWHIWFWVFGTFMVIGKGELSRLFVDGASIDIGLPLVMVSAGFVCIHIGFVLAVTGNATFLRATPTPWNASRVYVVCLASYLLGTIGRIYDYITRLNLSHADGWLAGPSNSVVSMLGRLPVFALLIAWIASYGSIENRRLRVMAWSFVALELAFAAAFGTMKQNFILPMVVPVGVAWVMREKLQVKWLIGAALILVLVAYPLVSRVREVYTGNSVTRLSAIQDSVEQLVSEGWFSSASPAEYAEQAMSRANGIAPLLWIIDLERSGLLNVSGEFYYRSVLALVPRFLWADKPLIHEGVYFTAYLRGYNKIEDYSWGDETSSTALTLFGSFYWNLLWPGLIISSALFGACSAWFYKRLFHALETPGVCLTYLACLPTFSTCENETVTLLNSFLYSLLMASCLNLLLRSKTPHRLGRQ